MPPQSRRWLPYCATNGLAQARYLLGLCQVFTKHYAEAVEVLEPLWGGSPMDVLYLYLLDIAAQESGKKELDEKI